MPKAQGTRKRRQIIDFIKIKNFCVSEETIKEMKIQLAQWKEIFAKYAYVR